MEEEFKKGKGKKCPQLLDLITNHGDWRGKEKRVEKDGVEVEEGEGEEEEEEEELELRLGPPGKEEHRVAERKEKGEEPSLLSLSKVAKSSDGSIPPCFGSKRGFLEGFQQQQQQQQQQQKQSHERKGSGLPTAHAAASGKAAGANNSSQTRTAAAPVVGWPPIRSFRKNLTSTSKPCVEPQNRSSENESEKKKGLFVKINMDGIPIGRKVDLKAYDSYENLSWAVDELFRGLLAAQRDPLATGTAEVKEKQVITGLLDGSGEYTLVYEDEEGDRMLIGDVPWNMFVSTAKRLRVMRTSDLSASFLRKVSRKRAANEC